MSALFLVKGVMLDRVVIPKSVLPKQGKKATAMRELLTNGFDPLEEKTKEANQPIIPTLEEAAQIVHQNLLPSWKNKKHVQYAFPNIGVLRFDCIQPKHIAETLRPIWLVWFGDCFVISLYCICH